MISIAPLISLAVFQINADDANIPRVAANQGTTDAIINAIFIVAGAVTVLFILISALRYIISQGEAAKVAQAKDGILYGLAGLVIITLAFTIVQVVINVIRGPQ